MIAPPVNDRGFVAVGLCAKALRFLEMHNNHNYLYYGDLGGTATVKFGRLPLHGQLRSTACCDGASFNVEVIFGVGICAQALRMLELRYDHNYLYYGDPGGAATVKFGGLLLRGQLRSTACCDSPPINDRGFRSVGLCAKALRFL